MPVSTALMEASAYNNVVPPSIGVVIWWWGRGDSKVGADRSLAVADITLLGVEARPLLLVQAVQRLE